MKIAEEELRTLRLALIYASNQLGAISLAFDTDDSRRQGCVEIQRRCKEALDESKKEKQ